MAINRDWFKARIKEYLKDQSVDPYMDTWIDLANTRVYEVLRCRDMESVVTRVKGAAEDYLTLPGDIKRVESVQRYWNGEWRNLRSVPRMDSDMYKGLGGPVYYYREQGKLFPVPFQDMEYRALCLESFPIDTTESGVPYVTYPHVFLSAMLAEAYDWKEDPEMSANYERKWRMEAAEITNLYDSERIGDAPAMRAC